MTDVEQREAARQFANKWIGQGKEDEDGRSYWLDFLTDVMGMDHATDRVNFEKKVVVEGNTKRIDVYIPETHVLIEQKSLGKQLDQKIHNSGDIDLTPYEQAKRYNDNLPYDEKARWIITSNFAEIWAYDMNVKVPKPVKIALTELPGKYPLLDFLVKRDVKKISHEMEVSIQAGDIVGLIYDAFLKQYRNPENPETLKSLNVLCVRLVFCLYAEDAGLFGRREMFHDYLAGYDTAHTRTALIDLFRVLDQKPDERDPYLVPELAEFPYVNGGLFADENIEIPMFTDEIRTLILDKASENFNWADISPTIFGAVFESTLNPETRRSGGMHYTSIENIHKVIDPLFLDDLKAELEEIRSISVVRTRKRKLEEYQRKLASLEFLDPAAGSGNFLTETYLSIRRLENLAIRNLFDEQITLGNTSNPIQVSISQFHGIEINDFAVTVAKTALWIAESQMMKETESILYGTHLEFLPLKTNANIVEGNALKLNWNDIVDSKNLNYIMGNPPFIGASMMSAEQKAEAVAIFGKGKRVNSIDYVGAWYYKAAKYIRNTPIVVAFVSTNSITQGEQAAPLWKRLLAEYGVHISFAYRTFVWDSEASLKAHVHCVIIGFSCGNSIRRKVLYQPDMSQIEAENINPYLVDAPDILIESRPKPISVSFLMTAGNKPTDGGNLILSEEEKNALVHDDPSVEQCVKRYVGSRDFINDNEKRYCLWLRSIPIEIYRKNKEIMRRLEAVRQMRLKSTAKPTRALADQPYRFFSDPQKDTPYICIPEVSSQRRRYIPMGFMPAEVIASNKLLIIPDAGLYEFGILESNVHMAWVRTVSGRLKSDYQYSSAVVYNTFPWPVLREESRNKIESTAQKILDVRGKYSTNSLADLYDPLTMPPELMKAHIANDRAVMQAYGFSLKMSESDCVAELMKMYQNLVDVDRQSK